MTDAAAPTTDPTEANVALVRALWEALGRRDFAAVAAMMADDGHYADVPVLDVDPGAVGPAQTEARLRLGIEPLAGYEQHDGKLAATGDLVIYEHAETWVWDDEHSLRLPFTSVMEVRDGKVARWWDYWDLQTLMGAAPPWWVERLAGGYQ